MSAAEVEVKSSPPEPRDVGGNGGTTTSGAVRLGSSPCREAGFCWGLLGLWTNHVFNATCYIPIAYDIFNTGFAGA